MTTLAPSSPTAHPLQVARVFCARSMRLALRDGEALVLAICLPVMTMLLFTYVFGGAMSQGGSVGAAGYLTYIVPGTILICAGFGAATTAVSVSHDVTTGTIDRLRTMPIPAALVLFGHLVTSLARNLIATAVVLVVAVVIGYRPSGGAGHHVVAIGFITLWILAITSLFTMLGLIASSPEAAGGYGFALVFLPYASSAFVPIATLPGWLQGFAQHQPVTPTIEAIRAGMSGVSVGANGLVAVAWAAGITAAAWLVIAWLFPRRATR